MSVNLCVDWGNSSVKAAIFDNETIVKQVTFQGDQALEQVTMLLQDHQPVKAILCSVVNDSHEVEQLLKSKISSFLKLDTRTRLPINNAYISADTLGADRLALVTAAHIMYPTLNNLVVCLGTCITYNFVQKTRTFRGGAISPGLQMRLQAMHTFTDKLPEVPVSGELVLMGFDTASCMRTGAVYGMAAEIDGMIKEYEKLYTDFNAILTGGDAPFFATKIKSKIFADPDLLVKGLNLILNYNVSFPR